ncbi:hypothetical protein K474DRAFT_1591636 [Panus rudis PR-1116 ss-1]|nr:hypothetical protein K474DRAFT_1591636 [Panus rudis PR-1116 ss-1]
MMFNNAPIIFHLAASSELGGEPTESESPPRREKELSQPCMIERLPNLAFIEREAHALLLKSEHAGPSHSSEEPDSDSATVTPEQPSADDGKADEISVTSKTARRLIAPQRNGDFTGAWKNPEPFEILRAIESGNIEFIMHVRDRAFHLLVRRTGGVTPLLHAMRVGRQDMAIILLGAFSRYINQLSDEDMTRPETKTILRVLRTNIKFAIDYGLRMDENELVASFLQTLIMSEGDNWVLNEVGDIALALRSDHGKPVQTAQQAVRNFAMKELAQLKHIASLEDYVANATADLLMMGAWSNVMTTVDAQPIPTYYFARDDRVYRVFCDRLDEHNEAIERTVSRRAKRQLRRLRDIMDGRATNYRVRNSTHETDTC